MTTQEAKKPRMFSKLGTGTETEACCLIARGILCREASILGTAGYVPGAAWYVGDAFEALRMSVTCYESEHVCYRAARPYVAHVTAEAWQKLHRVACFARQLSGFRHAAGRSRVNIRGGKDRDVLDLHAL